MAKGSNHPEVMFLRSKWSTTLRLLLPSQARGAKDPWCRLFARMSLAGLPRGGGDGDAIRMGILNIMREHGIREGHRPVSSGCTCSNLPQAAPATMHRVGHMLVDSQTPKRVATQSVVRSKCLRLRYYAPIALPLQGIECHFLEQWHQKLHQK